MKNHTTFAVAWLLLPFVLLALEPPIAIGQDNDPSIDHPIYSPTYSPVPRPNSQITVITGTDGYDNFDLGVDFAEGHTSTNPRNPLWWFNCWNTANTSNHHTENGLDWASSNAPFPSNSGDPVSAYDSLGNVYWMTMNGPTITGTWVVKSTNNGQSWGAAVASNVGNDKNWLAADQTMGPYANYIYGTMTNSGTGSFTRSTNLGASFTQTWSFSTQSLPGMMVCVGPNVLGGNNIPGGCVYVVTNSGSSFAATYTFYRSTDGGATFTFMSSQNFAGYVGTNVGGRNSVQNMRTRPYPFITADNSYGTYRGRLYLVYATNNPAGDGNKSDVYCRYSTDQGATWSFPVTINDDPNSTANYQWHPATWCDKETGRLYVKWLDTRDTPTSDSCDVYATYSDNGGTSFLPNQRLTNRKFRINCTTCGGGGTPAYLGDYDAITSNKSGAMAVWTDFRNGTFLSMAGYFPDFAMTVSPPADTLGLTDSVNVVVRVPSVKLYSRYVKFTASVSPAANFTFSFFGGKDSLTSYPDSAIMKIKANGVAQGVYTVTIIGSGPSGAAIHRRAISISALPSLVQVIQPNGGEQLIAGTTYPISWAKNLVDTVNIEYSTNSGSSWIPVASGVPARPVEVIHPKLRGKGIDNPAENNLLAQYNWTVPNTPSTNCLVRISNSRNPAVFDVSDASFTIVATPAPRWTAQTSGITVHLYAVSVVDTSIAWAAGDSGRTYRTVNGGASWVARASLTNPVSSISAISTNIAVAASNAPNNARIMRTINGGLGAWTQVYQDVSPGAYIDAVKMFDANNGFAVGDPVGGQWKLLRTTDGGATWFSAGSLAQAGSEAGFNNSMSWVGTQNGWFGTDNSRVYRTTNGGSSWSSAATTFTNSYAVAFATNQLGIASGNGTARSSDGGATWANTPAQPPAATFGSVPVPITPSRWYSVAGSGVYKSIDHGTTWSSEFSQANPYEAIDMKMVPVGGNTWLTGYAVGDNGTITKYVEILLGVGVQQNGALAPDVFALGQNYPNPFNPSTTIAYSLPEQATVALKIFDVLGQEIRTLVNGIQNAGTFDAVWDGRNNAGTQVASGMYYYRLDALLPNGSGFSNMKKLLLLK